MDLSNKLPLVLLISSLFISAALGAKIVCEELPVDACAYSIASSGNRCSLETSENKAGRVAYQCMTSGMVAKGMAGYIESDQCVKTCGVDRNWVGFSSDILLEPQFTTNLCSPACYQNCPNILDLYLNLAAAEGVRFIQDLCELEYWNPHRMMAEFSGPSSAPAPSPL